MSAPSGEERKDRIDELRLDCADLMHMHKNEVPLGRLSRELADALESLTRAEEDNKTIANWHADMRSVAEKFEAERDAALRRVEELEKVLREALTSARETLYAPNDIPAWPAKADALLAAKEEKAP